MELVAFTVIAIAFIAALFFAWYFKHKSNQEERQLFIEKGVDPSSLPDHSVVNFSFNFPWLKAGCIIISVAIGCAVAAFLYENQELKHYGVGFISPLFFGGIGLIIAYYIDKPGSKS